MRFHLGKTKISKIIHKLTLFIVHKERTKPLKKKLLAKNPPDEIHVSASVYHICISLHVYH